MSVQAQDTAPVMFSPRRIGHANLFVGDLARSMHFYGDICGFEAVFREDHIGAGFLSNGNTHHDVGLVQTTDRDLVGRSGHVQMKSGRALKPGLNHFGWEMESEQVLVEAYNRAMAAEIPIHRRVDHTLSHSIYVFDPDGALHEFYADFVKDWRSVFGDQTGQALTGEWDPNAVPAATEPRYHETFELRRVDEAPIHPVRFTNAVLMTRDFGGMVSFYADIAGLTEVYRTPDGRIVCFAGTKAPYVCDIALVKQVPGAPHGVHHYGYEMPDEDEFSNAEAAVEKAGIAIEKRIDNATKRSFFITDPDGMLCEFHVRRDADLTILADADEELGPYLV
jgi:catechol 2,3-dioxygenase